MDGNDSKFTELKKTVLIVVVMALLPVFLLGQQRNFWREIGENQIFLSSRSVEIEKPKVYRALFLNFESMKQLLQNAPMEGSENVRRRAKSVTLPLPDGSFEVFQVWNSPIMEPGLAGRHPEIQTFAGQGLNNPSYTLRLDYGPNGFHAIILSPNGGSVIVPYASGQNQYYLCYAYTTEDFRSMVHSVNSCGWEGHVAEKTELDNRQELQLRSTNTELRKYRYALACTGEFGARLGSKTAVLAAMVTSTNTLNSILERDVAIRLVLIANNDLIAFTDPNTDPYNNATSGGGLLRQNEEALNSIIGLSNYDIGHVFTTGCSDVGGVVSGTTCSAGKGRGVTCHSSTNVVNVTLNITVHEVGHQFSAGHTFNNCPGSEGQMSSGSAYEPGSGSTFLSYQRSCGESNIPGAANLHYHGGTIEQIWNYSRKGGGNICATIEPAKNIAPVVKVGLGNGLYIPVNTPFELQAEANDADGDKLTYGWEQINLGPSTPLGSPSGNSPLFRSYDPSASGIRTFPKIETIVKNGNDITEVLPNYSRNMKFRVTVRDNNVTEGAGGLVWQDVSFESTATAGPFLVTYPNAGTIVWKAGQKVTVKWDVAKTDNQLVNCQTVDIRLSTDGGFTYPVMLAWATPNDGQETIIVPEKLSTKARIKISAAENIFFDISDADFKIEGASAPTFTSITKPKQHQQVCVPNATLFEISTGSILNFNKPIKFDIVNGLPENIGVNFSKNPVQPGESSTLSFDLSKVTADGLFNPLLRAISGTDTVLMSLIMNLVYSDFSALKILEPANGKSNNGLLPVFRWSNLPQADTYDFQLATSPSFSAATMISEVSGWSRDTFVPTVALKESKIYFWRIRPGNECGKAEWTTTHAFQTFTVNCQEYFSSDVPKFISGIGLPVVQSVLPILDNSIITDINIIDLKGNHDALPHISVSLKSPKGTEVELFSKICGNVALFHLGLDDEAPFAIACPPLGGLKYKPQNPLSVFKGESTFGNWALTLKVINTDGQGGTLEKWGLEFCGPVFPKHPFLVNRDTLRVLPKGTAVVQNQNLLVQDEDDTAFQLKFTLLNKPNHGNLLLNGIPLNSGGNFTMADITAGKISYNNTNAAAIHDFFTFIVEDGGGGWLGTPSLPIKIGPLTNDTEVAFANLTAFSIFPNPATDRVAIEMNKPYLNGRIMVSDIHGRIVKSEVRKLSELKMELDVSQLPAGLYSVFIEAQNWSAGRKLAIIR